MAAPHYALGQVSVYDSGISQMSAMHRLWLQMLRTYRFTPDYLPIHGLLLQMLASDGGRSYIITGNAIFRQKPILLQLC
ncbi:hypothetical protein D3C76_1371390 [compost metagenome]